MSILCVVYLTRQSWDGKKDQEVTSPARNHSCRMMKRIKREADEEGEEGRKDWKIQSWRHIFFQKKQWTKDSRTFWRRKMGDALLLINFLPSLHSFVQVSLLRLVIVSWSTVACFVSILSWSCVHCLSTDHTHHHHHWFPGLLLLPLFSWIIGRL